VIAEFGERAQWVQNLTRDARVTVRLGTERFPAAARIVRAESEAALVSAIRRLSEAKYGWGDGLVVALTPQP
jgi:hypothetical protein